MATEYKEMALALRKEVSKTTLEQQKKILKVFDSAVEELREQMNKAHPGTITEAYKIR